jgi:D-alanyl-lipoteichoic acid acyltransferase DltB (MBOAT superfamily)
VIFNSLVFLAFFAITYTAYLLLGPRRHRLQNRLLLVASYVFYGWWDWRFLSLLLLATSVDFACAAAIRRRPTHARRYLTVSLCSGLGVLFVFKYFGFFADSFAALLAGFGIEASPITLQIVLPVGISFYTFQTLSYTIDVYRGRLEPCASFLDFALFVSFFPQLVAGPIERATNLLPQVTNPRTISRSEVHDGIWLIMWGFTKKVFIADNLAQLVERVYAPGFAASGGEALIATYAFAVQIFCDFSGYSDIARGLAKLMGFELMVNFDLPYVSRNPAEFWRRWHISLSTWLRDYLYIPLGGNRGGGRQTYRNLILTMLLGGLWHGAAWTFVLWGLYHGLLLAIHRALPERRRLRSRAAERLRAAVSVFVMFHLTVLGWLLFRASSLAQVKQFLVALVADLHFGEAARADLLALASYASVLVIVQALQLRHGDHRLWRGRPAAVQGLAFGFLFYLVTMHGAVSDAFIYFQF